MNRSIYLQIFVFALIIALIGSFNNYGQNMKSKDIKFIERNRTSNDIQSDVQNRSSNDIQLNMQRDSKVITNFKPNSVQTVLYDQTAGTTTSGIASQDFETVNDAFDCQSADDFTVPGGGWTIRRVIVGGFYATTGPAAGFNVYIYPNAAGVPGAVPVYSATSLPYSYDGATFYSIGLSSPAVLAAGTYWISIQCRMDFGAGGQWFGFTSTGTFGSTAQWQNPGGGFGTTCATWGPITTCNGSTETALSFALTDEACPVVPLPIVEDFESSVFPPLCWTIAGAAPLWYNFETVSGYGNGSWSSLIDFYSVGSGSQDLITLEFDASAATNPTLQFDWAYATYINDLDELDIYYSTNAGATWTILLAMPGGLNGILNPFHLATTDPYFPADNEWSTMSLDLPTGTNKIKFTGVTAFGNLCWVDNIAISDLFFDNFDSYTSGLQLCGQTTDWVTWSGPTGTAEDPFVSSTYSFSTMNSVKIVQNNDLVRVNGVKTSGVWYLSWMTYIPTGKAGYFNTLSDFAGAASEFAMQAFFDPDSTGYIDAGGAASASFFYPQNSWFQVWLKVDLDADLATLRINGSLVHTWQYTLGTFGTPTIALQLEANDFYGGSAADEMYIDNYYFSAIAPPIQQLAADAGMASIDIGVAIAPGSPTLMATVQNFGSATQSFDVTMTIGAYSSTKSVTALAPDGTQQVTFDPFTAVTGGPFTVQVCTELTGDLNTANDCSSQEFYIWDASGSWTSGGTYPITTFLGTGTGWNETTPDVTVGHLFSLGGVGPGSITTAQCYEYNVNTNLWSPIASMPGDRDRFASATVGDFIIAMGGYPEAITVPSGSVFKYDILANTWSTVAPLPTGEERGWHKAVSYNNNYVYVAGGITGDLAGTTVEESSVLVYNVTANTWSIATSMPAPRWGGAFSILGNQLIYIGGASDVGIEETVFIGTIDAGNPAIINWTTALSKFPGNQSISNVEYSASLLDLINPQLKPKDNSQLAGVHPAGGFYRFDAATWGADGVIVTTGAPGGTTPVDPTYTFVYYPGSDSWTAQPNLPTPVASSSFGTVNDGNTWKLIVAAGVDVIQTPLNITQVYTQTLSGATTFALSVDVTLGWNMVSAPGLHPTNQNVETWWPHRTGTVWEFNGVQYEARTVTTPGEGYWMKNTLTETYNYPAIQIVPHNPVPVTLGWNLMSGYETSPTITALKAANPQISGTVWGFNGIQYVAATNLVPGYGYWAKVTAAGNITIPDALAKGNGEIVELFKEDWGRITITDAAGISSTLYAVKGEVDLDQYEMPPLPPAGIFDIRFGSGRKAENLNSAIQTIDMNGITYPLTVRVEGMDIRLQDESGRRLNVNLKSGEDVVISDASIMKLMVTGELIPAEYALEQNYPNPFNPSTVIEFSLPEDVSNVKLSIYNALGEKVAELLNSSLTAGKYSYQWNAQNVATGMYIYELRTNNFVSVKKMLLLK